MTEYILSVSKLDNDLKGAIVNDEFVIFFQPQINLTTSKVCGLEALVRWQHPEQGIVAPSVFIKRAEETKQIILLGKLIFRKILNQMKIWQDNLVYNGVVAINISGVQIEDENFIKKIEDIRHDVGIEARFIELEVTESSFSNSPAKFTSTLDKLKKIGYQISIDDFGTGYSSLSYLKQLPLHKLKIDRSFIKDLPYEADDRAISKVIITLAKVLELDVIAEGVETQEQMDFLVENGCNNAQGYFFATPMSALDTEEYLQHN